MRADTEARRRHIRSIITTDEVESQAAILDALARDGFHVTQATVSRDLDAIGARRVRLDGRAVYRLDPASAAGADLRALLDAVDEFVLSMTASGNLLVLKVPPGAAQFVASRIDTAGVHGVLGSIAGDDTILVVVAETEDPSAVIRRLEGMV